MTEIVDRRTGELLDPLDREGAERLTTRIALRLDAMADTYAGVMPLIREAIAREAYRSLGYRSVGEYVQDRFGDALSKLGVDMRREVVRELTEAGLSTRAIAPVVGVSQQMVSKDQAATRDNPVVTSHTPAAPPATSGHTTQVAPDEGDATPAGARMSTEDPAAATWEGATPATPRPPVVGIDGKTYGHSEPRATPRRPLPDVARDAGWDLRKAVERLERLRADDRFGRNKNEVAAHLCHHLAHALKVLTDLEQDINSNPKDTQ